MNEFLDWALKRKALAVWLVAGGVLLLIVFGSVWWRFVYENPYNVWWDMLDNSLSTPSVTKRVVEQGSGTSLEEYVGENFGTNDEAYSRTTLNTGASSVTTESVSTLNADYIRYTKIDTKQKTKSGKPFNFSSVLGKWAKASLQTGAGQASATPFMVQTMLGLEQGNVVPIANLSAKDRASLVQQLHESVVFSTTFNNAKKSTLNGRPVYVYSVSIEPVAYVAFEKAFAADLGTHSLDSLDPNNYQGEQPIKVSLTVDIRSHELAEVSYVGQNHQEYYTSWGVPVSTPTPHATISGQTLQNLLNSIQ